MLFSLSGSFERHAAAAIDMHLSASDDKSRRQVTKTEQDGRSRGMKRLLAVDDENWPSVPCGSPTTIMLEGATNSHIS